MLHTSPDTWAATTAQTIADCLLSSLDTTGQASLVVPGGRSALAVLPLLAEQPLDWSKVTVTLSDERWVCGDHPDSNERLVRETLINKTGASFVGLKTDATTPQTGISECQSRQATLERPFAMVFLGMGEDGHIASLFPHSPTADDDFQAVERADHPRISMTPRCLLDSRHIVLPIIGSAKHVVFARAMQPGPSLELPVRHILQQNRIAVTVITD